jgi:hypothetical protein
MDTDGSLKDPWSSPKNFRYRRCRMSFLDQNLPRITNPVSDLTGDQSLDLKVHTRLHWKIPDLGNGYPSSLRV